MLNPLLQKFTMLVNDDSPSTQVSASALRWHYWQLTFRIKSQYHWRKQKEVPCCKAAAEFSTQNLHDAISFKVCKNDQWFVTFNFLQVIPLRSLLVSISNVFISSSETWLLDYKSHTLLTFKPVLGIEIKLLSSLFVMNPFDSLYPPSSFSSP